MTLAEARAAMELATPVRSSRRLYGLLTNEVQTDDIISAPGNGEDEAGFLFRLTTRAGHYRWLPPGDLFHV